MRQGVRHIKGKVISMSREGKEIISLSLDVGTKVSAHTYIFAMGAWSRIGLPEWIGQDVPVTPVRGQVLTLKGLTSPHRALVHGSNYLLPHWGRGCLGGTTEERVGFRDQVTHAGEKSILKKIKTMTNGHWTVLAGRSGLRPVSNDGLPIIGPIPGLNRAYLATGYGRKGILLGPLLGERLAEDIEKGTRSVPLDFRPGRG
jgi:D-amino-acid dehydrogenase